MDCVVVRSVGVRCVVEQGRGDAAYLKARPRPPKHSSRYFGGREGGGFSSFLPPSISFFFWSSWPVPRGENGRWLRGKRRRWRRQQQRTKKGSGGRDSPAGQAKEEGAAWENSFLFSPPRSISFLFRTRPLHHHGRSTDRALVVVFFIHPQEEGGGKRRSLSLSLSPLFGNLSDFNTTPPPTIPLFRAQKPRGIIKSTGENSRYGFFSFFLTLVSAETGHRYSAPDLLVPGCRLSSLGAPTRMTGSPLEPRAVRCWETE